MAITVNSLSKPAGVTATLQAGGNLAANTTYYVVVSALNFSATPYDIYAHYLISEVSTEISFITDSVNKTVKIDWDLVPGATYYNVYISTVSNTYSWVNHAGTINAASCNTNTLTIASPTNGNTYSADTLINPSNYYLPLNINKNLGLISVVIAGSSGVVTLSDLKTAIDNAGFSNYCYYDKQIFVLKGNIKINSGATGSMILTNTTLYFINGGWTNDSTTFDLTFGNYNAATKSATKGCVVFSTLYYQRMTNCKAYNTHFYLPYDKYLVPNINIGFSIYPNSNCISCIFEGMKNHNSEWSNNTLINPDLFRAWGLINQTNIYVDSNGSIQYYPLNGNNAFYDSTLKINNATAFAVMVGVAGQSNLMVAKFYDCIFTGAYYTSISNLIFTFSQYQSLTGFEFYYSVQGTFIDPSKSLIDGVTVKLYDKDNNLIFTAVTVAGILPKNYVKVMGIVPTGNGTGPAFYNKILPNPFTLVASKSGFETYTSKFDLLKKYDEIITLKPSKSHRSTARGRMLSVTNPELGSDSNLIEL